MVNILPGLVVCRRCAAEKRLVPPYFKSFPSIKLFCCFNFIPTILFVLRVHTVVYGFIRSAVYQSLFCSYYFYFMLDLFFFRLCSHYYYHHIL